MHCWCSGEKMLYVAQRPHGTWPLHCLFAFQESAAKTYPQQQYSFILSDSASSRASLLQCSIITSCDNTPGSSRVYLSPQIPSHDKIKTLEIKGFGAGSISGARQHKLGNALVVRDLSGRYHQTSPAERWEWLTEIDMMLSWSDRFSVAHNSAKVIQKKTKFEKKQLKTYTKGRAAPWMTGLKTNVIKKFSYTVQWWTLRDCQSV